MSAVYAVDLAASGEKQIDLGRDVVDGVTVSGSRGRRAGPAVQSRSGRLESGDDDGETGRVIQNLWFRVFLFPCIGIAVQNDVVLH